MLFLLDSLWVLQYFNNRQVFDCNKLLSFGVYSAPRGKQIRNPPITPPPRSQTSKALFPKSFICGDLKLTQRNDARNNKLTEQKLSRFCFFKNTKNFFKFNSQQWSSNPSFSITLLSVFKSHLKTFDRREITLLSPRPTLQL